MWTLIGSLASSVSGLLVLLSVVGGLLGLGAFEQHKIDADSLDKLKASYAQAEQIATAQAAATQKQIDDQAASAVQAEQAAQTDLSSSLQKELANAPIIHTVAANCVPYGLVRVLDAAASGRLSTSLALPAGKSDDACSSVTWAALERSVVSNYYTALANNEQLNALIAYLKKQQATFEGMKK
jgi:multidrug efflux pump subunit AcrA (membrane-fusion protein)